MSREYDPNTGRFQTKDEAPYIDFDDPQSLNQYVYCYSNPLRYIDPLGHAAAKINRKLTATGIKELVTGKVQSLYEGVVSGKLMNDLSMNFNQKLKTIKGAGKEVLEEGRVTLFKLTGTGGKAIKAAIEKGSLKAETYRVEMEKQYGGLKVAPPVIKVISEKEILRREREWRERVEFLTTSHWQGVKKGSEDLENTKEIELWDKVTEDRIQQLNPSIRESVRGFIFDVQEKGVYLRVSDGYRSIDEQNALYNQGRNGNSGQIVTNAKGGSSYHNYGLAIDIYEIKDGEVMWKAVDDWVVDIAESYGFEWGGM